VNIITQKTSTKLKILIFIEFIGSGGGT